MSITSVLTCLPGSYQTNRKKYLPVTSGRYSKYWNDQSNVGIITHLMLGELLFKYKQTFNLKNLYPIVL